MFASAGIHAVGRAVQMGADLERVQRERDAALERLSQQSSSGETLEKELEAARKQLRRVEVRAGVAACLGEASGEICSHSRAAISDSASDA